MSGSTVDVKYKCHPHDGTPGEAWEEFEERFLNIATTTDDTGYSWADCLMGVDQGSPGGPAYAGTAAQIAKQQTAKRIRDKESYGLLAKHELDKDHLRHMRANHWQDGPAAWAYLQGECAIAMDNLRLRELERQWMDFEILADVGVNENSILTAGKKLQMLNSKRPVASRRDQTEMTERLLELIFTCSKHFHQLAVTQYNAPAAQWLFTVAAGPAAGQRAYRLYQDYFHQQWKQAVQSKLPGFHVREPARKPAAPVRQTLEAGLSAVEGGMDTRAGVREQLLSAAGSNDFVVPRSGSPSESLSLLADAGDELANRRGTVTTTDFTLLTQSELACAACDDGVPGEFEVVYIFDNDDAASVEIVCDCCRGLGHVKRVCPSNRNRSRSLQYAMAALKSKLDKVGGELPRRPPGRGQRGPFRSMPRRFQPARKSDGKPFAGNLRSRNRRILQSAEEGDGESSSEILSDGSDRSVSSSRDTRDTLGSASEIPSPTGDTARRESINSARTMPLVCDDTLFERERLSQITEERIEPTSSRRPIPISVLCSIAALLMAVASSVLHGLTRVSTIGGIAVCTVLLSLAGRVGGSPCEYALRGNEVGMIVAHSQRATVDSGATVTAVPIQMGHLVDEVTDENPNTKIWIADDKGLNIVKFGRMNSTAPGFRLIPEAGVPKGKWKTVPCDAIIPSSRTAVVDGLGENTMLFSVKGLLKDGVKTFLNDDNSIQRSDCLLLSDGLTIVPFTNTKAYQVQLGRDHAYTASSVPEGSTTLVTSTRSKQVPRLFHKALGHCGQRRMKSSNLTIDGVSLSGLDHDPETCPGCRLGNANRHLIPHRSSTAMVKGASTASFSHFGQQVDSDICTGFEPSFPHGYTSMVNFKDRWGAECWLYFMRSGTAAEVKSSIEGFHADVKHRLKDGKVGSWLTDNSKPFAADETEDLASELVNNHLYSVPNDSNSLAVPERFWGIIERMMRSMHADAIDPNVPNDAGAPACLWPWAANQSRLLLRFLPTAAHNPPMSPYQFTTGDTRPQDLSWARTMFCDVTIAITDRDVGPRNKIGAHSADGCHLGYDPKRGCHTIFCESLGRISSFTVTEWRENSFLMCKRISADTPVEYSDTHELPAGAVTSALVPRRYTSRRAGAAAAAEAEAAPARGWRQLNVLVLFHRERDGSVMQHLRSMGHNATGVDSQNSAKQDLSVRRFQYTILDSISQYDFVFMCPPCLTACIAYVPPLRTYPQHPTGRPDLPPKQDQLVKSHNVLFDFCAEVIATCNQHQVRWALENPASRRRSDKAQWKRFYSNAFIWDYPPIEREMEPNGTATYRCCAQCQWDALWQKYTGLLSCRRSRRAFDNMFAHGWCRCLSHAIVLQGYDTDGTPLTSKTEYNDPFANALAHAIEDSCLVSDQEGERNWAAVAQNSWNWSSQLYNLTRDELCMECAHSLVTQPIDPNAPVTSGLTRKELRELHAEAHRTRVDVSPDVEIWLEDTEGAFHLADDASADLLMRVSESGSELANIKTVDQARTSKFWPLFKTAMEEEIAGKMLNAAWKVVDRPKGVTVHKSRWVFAVKLNDDNSISVVKTRFVGCGYSQQQGRDFESVFAATMPCITFRLLCAIVADEDLDTDHIDAVKAFTQAEIDALVYVEMPEGFGVSGCVLLLLKALEGIKQGANLWYELNRGAILKLGGKSSLTEANLYYVETGGFRIGVFADDVMVGFPADHRGQYLRFKREYGKIIKIGSSDTISPCLKFTGIQITRDRPRRILSIHQERYLEQLGEQYKDKIKHQDTPHGVSKEQRAEFESLRSTTATEPIDKGEYLQIVGKLVWPMSMTRVDCAMAMSTLCSCVGDPREIHRNWAFVVMGYMVSTKKLGITYGGKLRIPYGLDAYPLGFEESCGLYTAHDSSWGTRVNPLGGYVIMYNNGAIDYSAKLVKIVPDSSCEAESAVASLASKATCYVRATCQFHRRRIHAFTAMLGDNKALYDLVQQEGASVRTRYFERATLLIKRAVLMLILKPFLVSTHYMLADMFTKPLEKSTFIRFRNVVMNNQVLVHEALSVAIGTVHGEARRLMERLLHRG